MSDSDLMEISGFNSQDWDTMKIATAMKMIAYPDEKVEHPPEVSRNTTLLVCFHSPYMRSLCVYMSYI